MDSAERALKAIRVALREVPINGEDTVWREAHEGYDLIAAALREQPEARGVVDDAIRSLAADMMTVVSEVDDIGALGSHVVAFANRLNALTGERNG